MYDVNKQFLCVDSVELCYPVTIYDIGRDFRKKYLQHEVIANC